MSGTVNITPDGKRTVFAKPEWFPRPDGFERAVMFQPGYNGTRNYGVHGMEITWLLRGPAGGVQFMIYTNWIPGELSPGHGLPVGMSFPRRPYDHYPIGADLGYHSPKPTYEDQPAMSGECHVIGGTCYYDGSGMAADRLVKRFVVEGEPVVWVELESFYAEQFGGAS